jgi:hypothetical protein
LRGNKLDCVFFNAPELITNVNCVNLIEFDIKLCFQKAKAVRRTVYDFKNANFNGARRENFLHLFRYDSAIFENADIDECWKAWKGLFITAIVRSVCPEKYCSGHQYTTLDIDRDVN